ncbi:1,4-alpha-glucan branching protein GlgB [Nitratifractor sp.]
MNRIRYDISPWGETDTYLFKEGTHTHIYEILGSHLMERDGVRGVYFAVWAPHAQSVSVVGDFNAYTPGIHPLKMRIDGTGVWEGFIPDLGEGPTYKYHITGFDGTGAFEKIDPVGFHFETPPKTATRIRNIDGYDWGDAEWMERRHEVNAHDRPINVYEMHLGSWRRKGEAGEEPLSYVEAARELADYLVEMNYTHVEIMPVTEYPFEGSWGYQVTGYFAPTSRYGTPQEFMAFVDILHQNGIGVIVDWVPSHFVTDGHGLIKFDGTALYEHEDPRQGFHPEWGSAIFNYGRNEVRAFLVSSAMFWFQKYHIDGIRVDAVASMLYLDYARKEGEWIPNKFGGNENLDAIAFLRQLNESVYRENKGILMMAEESTAFPMVSRPVYLGGLEFGYKWNMGWMHDTLKYFKLDPIHRQHHHHQLTFSFIYMYQENYILPLSHDEVVHMKGSLIEKMPGDEEQKFANLRSLFAYMTAHPGKKLLFMGGEFAQWSEWNYQKSLDWHLLENPKHRGVRDLVRDLNALYRDEPALHRYDCEAKGFEWIDELDYQSNLISFLRKSDDRKEDLLVVCHLADTLRENYRIGVPFPGSYRVIFNSQASRYGGWDDLPTDSVIESEEIPQHGREHSLALRLPPLCVLFLKQKD